MSTSKQAGTKTEHLSICNSGLTPVISVTTQLPWPGHVCDPHNLCHLTDLFWSFTYQSARRGLSAFKLVELVSEREWTDLVWLVCSVLHLLSNYIIVKPVWVLHQLYPCSAVVILSVACEVWLYVLTGSGR